MWCGLWRFNLIPRDNLFYRFYWHNTYFTSFLKEKETNFIVFLKKRNTEKLFCYFCLDNLICFLNNKISLSISNFSSCLFALFGWHSTVQNELLSGFKCLMIVGAFGTLPLDPTRRLHRQVPYSAPWIPTALEALIRCWLSNDLLTLFFPSFFKTSSF